MAYYEGNISDLSTGNNNGFGNGWEGLIGLALVASLFGGGWGFGGFGGNRGGVACATQADLSAGFANSEIMSDLNSILLGQATMQNFINQGFAGLNNTITTGFAGVNNAICTLGYQNQTGFNALSRELADCCCSTKGAIADLKYSNERQTCDIISAINAGNQRLVDIYTSDKISALQAENNALKGQISNNMQTRAIVDELRNGNCPVPAYITCDPRVPVNYNSCGCC